MPGCTWVYAQKPGVWVEGLYNTTPQEIDPQAVADKLNAAFDAWPWLAFWDQIDRVTLWSDFHPNKLQYFKDNPRTSGLYRFDRNTIDLNGSQYLNDSWGVLFHELGHAFNDIYRIGAFTDAFGIAAWNLQAGVSGTDSGEEFANNVGRVLLRRIDRPREMVPKGFESFLEYVRQVRS